MAALKLVICKGVAGLGNRMQLLGAAVDLALDHGATLCVDWRDPTFKIGFDLLLELQGLPVLSAEAIKESADVFPDYWRGHLTEVNPKKVTDSRGEIFRWAPEMSAEAAGHEAAVVCGYKCSSSDRLFQHLRLRPTVQERVRGVKSALPARYQAVHIRATDRAGEDADTMIGRVLRNTDLPVVLVTDNQEVAQHWRGRLILSPGSQTLPPVPLHGGVHHIPAKTLEACQLSKASIWEDALLDVLVLAGADEAFSNCGRRSSFYQLAQRIRSVGWGFWA